MRAWAGRTLRRSVPPSRITGLVLLAVALLAHVVPGDSEDVPWRHDWWDRLHSWSERDRGDPADAPAVIVAIDEATRAANGPWPWPRDKLASLVRRIGDLGASAVASDIILAERDPQSPIYQAQELNARADGLQESAVEALTQGNFELAEVLDDGANRLARAARALESLGDWDMVLRDAFRGDPDAPDSPGIPTVLPVTGVPDLTDGVAGQGCDFAAPQIVGADRFQGLVEGFNAADPPYPLFSEPGPGLQPLTVAAIDFSAAQDFVVRRVKAVQPICGKHLLMLGAEALRLTVGNQPALVEETPTGLNLMLSPGNPEAAAFSFPTERDGTFWLHFGALGTEEEVAQRYISAQSLFASDVDPDLVRGKIVLLAVIDLGRIDERRSPLGDIIWGIEAHVQMIEQIIAQDFLRRPWFLFIVEVAITGLLAVGIIVVVPRAPPGMSLATLPLGIALMLLLSLLAFRGGLLIDLMTPALGVGTVAVGVIGATLIERDRARLTSEIQLQSERADRAVLQGELDAAARIQTALLPPTQVLRDGALDLSAYILPARTVGGDFFDHTMIDDRHLFFLVADVSGKGADASQFMVLSKTLWKSAALREGPELGRILQVANAEIVRENAARMFVTGLCGVLDLANGRVLYASAGHDAPVLFGAGQRPCQVARPASPPVGLVDGLGFAVGEISLAPGQRLCMFTDGVTEAMNAAGALFGLDGLLSALEGVPATTDSAGAVARVLEAVRRFTDGAVQSDDLTLMVLSRPD
ncbi:MAG: SpoIIE family protein phosphatase [Pseudomonadota bacterium]